MINKAISAYSKQSSIQVRARSSESYESPSYYETLAKACSQAILSAPTEALECAAPMRPIYETPQDTPYREELRRAVIPLAKRYVAIFETDLDSAAAKDRLESTIEFYSRNDALVARLEGLVEALSE